MKIAYVTVHIEPKLINGGVGKKIASQLSIWNSLGHTADWFALTPAPISSLPDGQQFVFAPSGNLPILKLLTREMARSAALSRLIQQLRVYRPDIIYLRFGLFAFPLHRLFAVAPVVLEVNSNDLDEYRSRGRFFYVLNRATRNLVFARCAGWVALSKELANLPANRRHRKPVCVISNGIELDKYQPMPPPHNQLPELALVGSPGMSWHGVDKLISLAKGYPDLQIHIIGYGHRDVQEVASENMHFHGYLEPEAVRHVLKRADVVFGTLALHRKNMDEASPLKVREALAYGIPVVLGYEDTDLAEIKSDLILHIPNTETNVLDEAASIREFAFRVRGRRVDRGLIAERIDQRHKEAQRLKFFEEVLAEGSSA